MLACTFTRAVGQPHKSPQYDIASRAIIHNGVTLIIHLNSRYHFCYSWRLYMLQSFLEIYFSNQQENQVFFFSHEDLAVVMTGEQEAPPATRQSTLRTGDLGRSWSRGQGCGGHPSKPFRNLFNPSILCGLHVIGKTTAKDLLRI